ncbi:general transcription factor 3C polypeptide 1 isoform X2 [Acipenser ruthenus]|uniref:general transcription factor 3C polypeptide 1 isoform X2 n=1 Tax=Acipenser ruthenus TaxID=7906 RepID=UPI002740FB9D|nr:general transcription factor 3C polypeptide 1 isoform X2 [Acipenser ruthenus]
MDALLALEDEVALEGLDGITLSGLWFRIQNRVPKFPLLLDPATKQFLWQALVCNTELEFYELPKERPAFVFFDRFKEIDPETGIQEIRKESSLVEDVYPVHIVFDNKKGIKGSCQFFNERRNVTDQIRNEALQPCCTLEEAVDRWADKLVVVASQRVRYRALIGWEGNPELKLPDYSYCILERLGRARWQGELQRDLHCGAFKTDARKLHYLRKVLDRNDLLTMQSHVIRLPNSSQQHSILLLLKRFHVDRRSKYAILMERVSNVLAAKPGKLAVMIHLRHELGLCERTFKRMYQYMIAAGIAQVVSVPLHELNPETGHCKTKKGTDIIVRCLKLLKEYKKKAGEGGDDNEEEEDNLRSSWQPVERVWERDMLAQAYELIESRGTTGIPQTEIRLSMNIGKLEARMICRLLERCKLIKGFMEDEGRQRTTKYISKMYVERSDLNQQFEKEKARSEQLSTVGCSLLEPVESQGEGRDELPSEEEISPIQSEEEEEEEEHEGRPRSAAKKQKTQILINPRVLLPRSKLGGSPKQSTPCKRIKTFNFRGRAESPILPQSAQDNEETPALPEEPDMSVDVSEQTTNREPSDQAMQNDRDVAVIEEVRLEQAKDRDGKGGTKKPNKPAVRIERPHETYRLLKRKNMIIEAVHSLKLIDSLYSLQKMIMDEEKQDGVGTRCCKKSILRLVHKLSQDGMLRLYRTTVIQDGISKKVEFIVHPSVLPQDPLVKSAVEQVRFRISSSYTAHRVKSQQVQVEAEDTRNRKASKDPDQDPPGEPHAGSGNQSENTSKPATSKTDDKMGVTPLKNFHPTIVPGLGRSLGFLPKMPRLRLVHIFLWYVVYGHPLRKHPEENPTPQEEPGPANQNEVAEEREGPAEAEESIGGTELSELFVKETVYVDQASWKRFVPPTPVHREFEYGWALVSDILLCLPLSIFIQIMQVSYQVDNLEEYLSDPIKQHTLVRFLPQPMRQQLLYKRKYIFSFYESLQRMCYLGVLQFGPIEKFQDKDQVFVYVKKKAAIVDTTTCDPHYNLALSSRPFEKRFYTFNSLQQLENFWFDLQCVCLNTPLGIVRGPRTRKSSSQKPGDPEMDSAMEPELTAEKQVANHKLRMYECARGRKEVLDDREIPGDGQGAAGLDSGFFSHLKRNWIWTSYILNKTKRPGAALEGSPTLRLQTFLTKHPLPLMPEGRKLNRLPGLKEEEVQVEKEPAMDRTRRVAGGKKQKRKRLKKDTGRKAKRKRKEGTLEQKRGRQPRFHDEADQSALQRMTRQRVAWTAQEDGFLMLCRVASHVLNRKVKGPFVPWQVVRDILHANFEESLDKTSLSVGRRARYIMKNPQTSLNFKICLAEVYQDKALVEEYLNRKNDYQSAEVCGLEFKEFVEELRRKLSSVVGDSDLEIPDTKEELFRRFKVSAIGEEAELEEPRDALQSLDDIHSLVLSNLIQSTLALSNTQMKSCQSFQTFHLYRKYKDEVLFKVFLDCQKRGLVNRRRVNQAMGPKKSRALPFVPMSYQLSQTYYRCFTWRFPSTLCTESNEFLEKLQSVGREDRPNTFTFQHQESMAADPDMVLFPLDGPGGNCLASLSLLILGLLSVEVAIPDQIVVVDSTMVDNEVIKSLGKEGVEDSEEGEGEDSENKRKMEVKSRQASHTNYLLMRGYCAPGIVSTRNLNTSDNVVVNSCQMRVKLRRAPAHSWIHTAAPSVVDVTPGQTCLPPSFTRLVKIPGASSSRLERFQLHCVDRCGYSPEDLQAMLEICSAIKEGKSFGIDRNELERRFSTFEEPEEGRTRTFSQYLQDLINLEEVLEVGGDALRVVAIEYVNPWLLHITTPRQPQRDEESQQDVSISRKRKLEECEPGKGASASKRAALEAGDSAAPGDSGEASRTEDEGNGNAEENQESTHRDREEGTIAEENQESAHRDREEGTIAEENQESAHRDREEGTVAEENQESAHRDREEGTVAEENQESAHRDREEGTVAEENHESAHRDREEVTVAEENQRGEGVSEGASCEVVGFLSRPWRIVDGSLNKPLCKGMMEAVLLHIMTRPGVPEQQLVRHYQGVLQPVAIRELLQALEDLGCLLKRSMRKPSRVSLFSSPGRAEESVCMKQKGSSSEVFYEPTIDCCLRLGKVFPHEANWNKWVKFLHT